MKTIDILRAARAKIERPGTWSQGAIARDGSGRAVSMGDPSAECFCSYAAVAKACDGVPVPAFSRLYGDAVARLSRVRPRFSVWQDSVMTTHAEVLAAFDRAIAAEEAKQ